MNRHMRTSRSHNKGGKKTQQHRVHLRARLAREAAKFNAKKKPKIGSVSVVVRSEEL